MANTAGRVVVLLLLILILVAGALVWFDFLGLIDIKTTLAPIYKIPFVARITGVAPRTQTQIDAEDFLNLDAERLAVRLEAYNLLESELKNRESELETKQNEIEQMAADLEERQKILDEREATMSALASASQARDANIEQVALWLNNMPPDRAVPIIVAMDDQDVIDLFRKVEQLAAASGASSLVPVWLMNAQMPPDRAAALQRKMGAR